MSMDMNFVESQFPALRQREFTYLDNAGGSLVLKGVAARVSDYLLTSSVQHGATYSKSAEARDKLRQAQESVARLINAKRPEEVVMGSSTTWLLRVLADAIGETLKPGDEIICSQSEHESNYGAWEKLTRRGVKVIPWPFDLVSFRLSTKTLQSLMTPKTKLVCCTHASNIFGTINPIREIADMVHANGAKLCVDSVAYAPHRLVDVQASDADFYVFSFYKVYGPHHAVMFGKYDELLKLPNQNHFFIAEDRIPYKLQPGNVNYELAYGSIGIEDYLLELGAKDGTTPRQKMAAAFDQITQQEELLSASLLNYLTAKNNVRIIGETSHAARLRVPTISFVVEGVDSESIVSQMDKFNIGIRYGDFYARRLVQALGLEKNNGVVRVSMVHYNTIAEVEKLISKLDAIL